MSESESEPESERAAGSSPTTRPVLRHFSETDEVSASVRTSPAGAPDSGEAISDRFSSPEIFVRVAATADGEFQRTPRMLFFSGVAAGLSLGITLLARSTLTGLTPDDDILVGDLIYPIGFLVVVLGGYQLFTENTLTPVTLVLARLASLPALLRMWGIVYVANLLGALAIAAVLTAPGALSADAARVAALLSEQALQDPASTLFVRGVLAGGVVASMVWLVHAVRDGAARVLVVYGLALVLAVAELHHCITGFVEVAYGVISGDGSPADAAGFLAVVTAGNIVGGVALVAIINYGQMSWYAASDRLGWKQFLLGAHGSRDGSGSVAPELDRTPDDDA